MIAILRILVVAMAVSLAALAQTPQRTNAQQNSANRTQPANAPPGAPAGQQANAATVRNDRLATMPRIGVSASLNPNQNELVGCVVAGGNNVYLHQPELRRTYQLRGNNGQLQANVGQLVQVTGRVLMGTPAAFEVQQVQVVQPKCNYAQVSVVLPATGNTGAEGTAFNVTSTASVGQPTPGVQTVPGMKQNPSISEPVSNFGAFPGPHPANTASTGAPPEPRVESPLEAERIANSATRSELNNQRQLGVNAQPNYAAESNPQQTQQFTAGEAQSQRGQATGSTQVLRGGGPAGNAMRAEEEAGKGTSTVFTGCVQQNNDRLVLVETATNQVYDVEAKGINLGSYLNQQVRIVGNSTGTYGPGVGTAGNNATVYVNSIRSAGSCNPR